MHIHVLGICGTLMGSLAILAHQLGHNVTGSDENIYPPMSTLLENAGIRVMPGFDPTHMKPDPDLVVIGNANLARGNPAIEHVLDRRLPFQSGAEWLSNFVLQDRWVIGVAGTHGKTTTASMVAWILQFAGMKPGFLIGGSPLNFPTSAELGSAPFFVIEADEYDTSYFDRRSKFLHYRPTTLILNNLEYDHADIFPDIESIKNQFHLLLRCIPSNGQIIVPVDDEALADVLHRGCWTPVKRFSRSGTSAHWQAADIRGSGGFSLIKNGEHAGDVIWNLTGEHNISNALAAIAAAHHVGIPIPTALEALHHFKGVKRRLELLLNYQQTSVYDDFAHHPTAIASTLAGLRAKVGRNEIVAIIEPASHTMRGNTHLDRLCSACADADRVLWYHNDRLSWHPDNLPGHDQLNYEVHSSMGPLLDRLADEIHDPAKEQHFVIMSNGKFDGIHQLLCSRLTRHGDQ